MWDYSPRVMEHFLRPHNVGELPDADVVAEVGNITCGDALKLYLKVTDGRILDVRFKTFGCASAIASSSVLTDMLKGKSIEEAARITEDDIARELGGLPEAKMHCSVMGRQALEKAIAIYRGQIPAAEAGGPVVCHCFGVTEQTIERAVREHNLTTVEQVTHYTKAGGGCGGCRGDVEAIIRRVQQSKAPAAAAGAHRLTNIERIRRITEVIDTEIRPALRRDGGDLELVDIDGRRVLVALRGMCVGCPASGATIKELVQKRLRELVDAELVIEEVQ